MRSRRQRRWQRQLEGRFDAGAAAQRLVAVKVELVDSTETHPGTDTVERSDC